MQFPKDTTSILILAGLAVLLILYLANNYLKDTVKDEIVEFEKKKNKEKIEKIKKIKKNQLQQQMQQQQLQQQQMLQQQILQQMAKQNGNINMENEMDDLESYVDPLKNDNFDMGNNMGEMGNIGMNGGNGGNNSGAHFQDQQNQMLNDRIFNN